MKLRIFWTHHTLISSNDNKFKKEKKETDFDPNIGEQAAREEIYKRFGKCTDGGVDPRFGSKAPKSYAVIQGGRLVDETREPVRLDDEWRATEQGLFPGVELKKCLNSEQGITRMRNGKRI